MEDLIAQIIAKKQGDKEFLLHYCPSPYDGERGYWEAEIGNTSDAVQLGEAPAEFYAQGLTIEQALNGLLEKLP